MRLLLAAALSLTPMIAFAQDDSPQEVAVEARHGFMLMMASNMGPLAAMAKGDAAYDEAAASAHAGNIETLTRYPVAMHFIPGTAKGEVEGSDALPKIWQDMDGFGAKFKGLQDAAAGAGDAAKGGQQQVAALVQKLGGACKACHDEYRAPQ